MEYTDEKGRTFITRGRRKKSRESIPLKNSEEPLKSATEIAKNEDSVNSLEKKESPKEALLKDDKRICFAPEGDKRLTINLRADLHKKLKIAAVENNTTAGVIIEQWIEKYL